VGANTTILEPARTGRGALARSARTASILAAAFLLAGCATLRSGGGSDRVFGETVWDTITARFEAWRNRTTPGYRPPAYRPPAARPTDGPGQEVLAAGHRIAVVEKKVIQGSCWDFVNAVYHAAGFPERDRVPVFLGKQAGPYADPSTIQPGDWVMHRNLEYGEIEHSSIFVQWLDSERFVALTLDYAGMNRTVPGRYSEHRYGKVFAILRPAKKG
jgi:hypothetical protein